MNKELEVFNSKENVDPVKGILIFDTDIEFPKGEKRGILFPTEENEDKVILNQYYSGGKLKVKMKIIGLKPYRPKVGEKIATLVLLD